MLLTSLAPEAREVVLARLEPERGSRLRAQIQRIDSSGRSREVLDQVLHEFGDLVQKMNSSSGIRQNSGSGRPGIPANSATAETGQREADAPRSPEATGPRGAGQKNGPPSLRLVSASQDDSSEMRYERRCCRGTAQLDGQRLAAALFGEHPRTVSMVLNSLETDKAGEVLKRLRPETRRDVSLRLSQTARSGPDVLQHIARALLKKSGTLRDAPAKPSDDGYQVQEISRHAAVAGQAGSHGNPGRLAAGRWGYRSQDQGPPLSLR